MLRGNRCEHVRSWHTAEWESVAGAGWTREIMTVSLSDRLHVKQGRSIARWTLGPPERRAAVFVKRHYHHPRTTALIARVLRRVWASDAGRELHHLQTAQSLGIPTPEPMACAEWPGIFGGVRSVLIVRELTGMLALHEALPLAAKQLPREMFLVWKRGLIRELARLVQLMHDRGYFHRDLYLCHFFIHTTDCASPPGDWTRRVVLIDFHRLTRRPFMSVGLRAKDLAQLLFSAQASYVSDRDVVQFWRLYRGQRRSRLLRWFVLGKFRRYVRHNRRLAAL